MTSHGRRGLGERGPGDVIFPFDEWGKCLALAAYLVPNGVSPFTVQVPFCWRWHLSTSTEYLYLALPPPSFFHCFSRSYKSLLPSMDSSQASKERAKTESSSAKEHVEPKANWNESRQCCRVSPSLGLNRVTTPTVAREHKSGGNRCSERCVTGVT